MLAAFADALPSRDQVAAAADVASTAVCYVNAWKRAKWAIGLLVATLVLRWLTSGAEDLDDLTGVVDAVEDSHVLEDVGVSSVDADRVNARGVPVVGSAVTLSNHLERKRPDGTVEHTTQYTCSGPTLRYTNAAGDDVDFPCGTRAGQCPVGNGYVTTFKNGTRSCVFGTEPTIHCKINGSAQACRFRGACPSEGESVRMARATKGGALACAEGQWNRARVSVRYVPPTSDKERTQTFTLPMSGPGASKYAVGASLPVYYSRKHHKIYLSDSNMSSVAGFLVKILALVALYKTVDAASFLYKPVCLARLGLRVADKLDDKLGL